MFYVYVIRTSEIFVNYASKIFTLLAFTQYVGDMFHSFSVLCENEYFLISSLH